MSIWFAGVVLGVSVMTLCPIAIAVGCKKCPVFGFCPVKSVIGDYKKEEEARTPPRSVKEESKPKQD